MTESCLFVCAGMSRTNSEAEGPESLGSSCPAPTSSCPPTSHAYTRGVEVVQANISGPGELSLWEFSGQESYFSLYDHFIGIRLVSRPTAYWQIVIMDKGCRRRDA